MFLQSLLTSHFHGGRDTAKPLMVGSLTLSFFFFLLEMNLDSRVFIALPFVLVLIYVLNASAITSIIRLHGIQYTAGEYLLREAAQPLAELAIYTPFLFSSVIYNILTGGILFFGIAQALLRLSRLSFSAEPRNPHFGVALSTGALNPSSMKFFWIACGLWIGFDLGYYSILNWIFLAMNVVLAVQFLFLIQDALRGDKVVARKTVSPSINPDTAPSKSDWQGKFVTGVTAGAVIGKHPVRTPTKTEAKS